MMSFNIYPPSHGHAIASTSAHGDNTRRRNLGESEEDETDTPRAQYIDELARKYRERTAHDAH